MRYGETEDGEIKAKTNNEGDDNARNDARRSARGKKIICKG